MKVLILSLAFLVLLVIPTNSTATSVRITSLETYAKRLVLRHWHSRYQWRSFWQIAHNESGWDSCAHYPSTHDCRYTGSNACGIPQADPCPFVWRGRLYGTRYVQVRWMVRYISGRYGNPSNALAHEVNGSY